MLSTVWQLDGTVARAAIGQWRASVELLRPAQGIVLERISPHAPVAEKWKVLGIDFGERAPLDAARLDSYTRASDLVATYDEAPAQQICAQIYWRVLEPDQFAPQTNEAIEAAFELIVSANTSRLDGDPQSAVHSQVAGAVEVLELAHDDSDASAITILPAGHAVCACQESVRIHCAARRPASELYRNRSSQRRMPERSTKKRSNRRHRADSPSVPAAIRKGSHTAGANSRCNRSSTMR